MANTRTNCDRIREIEDIVLPLLQELVGLVEATDEEKDEVIEELSDYRFESLKEDEMTMAWYVLILREAKEANDIEEGESNATSDNA